MINLVNSIDDWKKSSCTCKYFSKKYFCSHIIVVAVAMKLVEIPNESKNVNIGNKKAPGRHSKIKTGKPLQVQANIV